MSAEQKLVISGRIIDPLGADLVPTKGSLLTSNGTIPVTLNAGADNLFLVADSSAASGLRYTSGISGSNSSGLSDQIQLTDNVSGFTSIANFKAFGNTIQANKYRTIDVDASAIELQNGGGITLTDGGSVTFDGGNLIMNDGGALGMKSIEFDKIIPSVTTDKLYVTPTNSLTYDSRLVTTVDRVATFGPSSSDDNTLGYKVGSIWLDTANKINYVCFNASTGAALWSNTPTSLSITASNAGASGVGTYKEQVGSDLRFRRLLAGSGKITVTDSGNTIDIDVDPSAISIGSLSGIPSGAFVGISDTQTLTNKSLVDSSSFIVDDGDNTKKMTFSVGGNTTGKTLTLSSAVSDDRTISYPDSNGTVALVSDISDHASLTSTHGVSGNIVGTTDIQTLTNKKISDTTTSIVNASDPTKTITFNANGNTTGTSLTLNSTSTTNRTLTLPDATDTLIARTTIDTLTNKKMSDTTTSIVNASDPTKTILFSSAGNTTGTSMSLNSATTVNRTLTLPDTTDTLIARNTTDTITNKSLVDSSSFIVDDGDNTKRITFSSGGNATASTLTLASTVTTNKTITIPDVTDTLITRTTTDVLTNKSLSDSTTNIVNVSDATKRLAFNVGGNATASTLTLASSASVDRTLTLPDVTDILVTRTTTDTLTNKKMSDTTTSIVNASDPTKTILFSSNGNTTGTSLTLSSGVTANRTLTLPNATDTLVGKATTDVLTNKSLSDSTTFIVDETDVTKKIAFSSGSNVPNSTLTLMSQITADQTLMFPDTTDVLVAQYTADVLYNKSLEDSSNFIINGVDDTKRIGFDLGNSAASSTLILSTLSTTDRTLIFPDADDTLIGKDTTDTLTNKKLSDTTTSIISVNDATKIINFSADNNTTGTALTLASATTVNRFLVFPDVDDVLVGKTTSDTLTNKKLSDATTYIVDNADDTKRLTFSVGNNTASTTMTLASSTTANRTLTLPDVTDTLITRTTTDTLTNKKMSDTTTSIVNAGDPTKTILFSSSGNTTGTSLTLSSGTTTNRVLTLPNITDTLVTRNTTDTLTNKSLDDNTTFIVDNTDATKRITFSSGGNATASTLTLNSIASVDRTLTLPDVTDTLITRTTTDTLTNKKMSDTTTSIVNASDPTKTILFSSAGNTTGTSLTLSSMSTTNKTLTLPDATDTLIARNTTDTLTNKSLVDSSSFIVDEGDATKRITFSSGGNTTGTLLTLSSGTTVNRTLTLPDATDTLVGKATTDTLTNKTLLNPLINTSTNTDLTLNTNGTGRVILTGDPTASTHASNKKYVDDKTNFWKLAVVVKTTVALPAYTAATNTLTANANAAFPTTDGVALTINQRIFVDILGATSAVHTGIYTLSQVGSVALPWILTRATDFNTTNLVYSGSIIPITSGTLFGGLYYQLVTANPITVGTTSLSYSQYDLGMVTTKGDLYTRDANALRRLGVGANNTFLVADSTQATGLSWRTLNSYTTIITATNTVTTTSLTYVTITNMTATPAAGTYLVKFSSSGSTIRAANIGQYVIAKNGTAVSGSGRDVSTGSNALKETALYTEAIVTANGTDVIDARYLTTNATATFNVKERTFILIQLA